MTHRVLVFSSGATVTHTRGLLSLSLHLFFSRENDDGAQLINNDCKNSLCVHVDGWMRRIKLSTQHRRYRRNLNKKTKMETDGDDFLSHSVRALFRWKGQRKLRWKSSQVQWNDWRLFSVCVFIFFFLLLGNSFYFWNLDDVAVLAVGWPTSSFCLTISWYNDMWSRNDEKLSRRLFPMYLSYTHQSKRVRESFA